MDTGPEYRQWHNVYEWQLRQVKLDSDDATLHLVLSVYVKSEMLEESFAEFCKWTDEIIAVISIVHAPHAPSNFCWRNLIIPIVMYIVEPL